MTKNDLYFKKMAVGTHKKTEDKNCPLFFIPYRGKVPSALLSKNPLTFDGEGIFPCESVVEIEKPFLDIGELFAGCLLVLLNGR